MNYQYKKKFLVDLKHYYWDEPLLFKRCADNIFRRSVPKEEIENVITHCHASAYGGHASTSKNVSKSLKVSLFKDVCFFTTKCDQCQWVIKIFDVWGIDFLGLFPPFR